MMLSIIFDLAFYPRVVNFTSRPWAVKLITEGILRTAEVNHGLTILLPRNCCQGDRF